ncbi:hypothetical protein GF361_02690 [Candidatus Woesearchaeota archaeon]|nr:hypothetical protein [Candidatus Woesearchaeota archaeon]
MSSSKEIIIECMKYNKHTYLVNKDQDNKLRANCRSILDLVGLGAAKDTALEIIVEGDDEEAEELATRLYNALRCEDSYYMGFENGDKRQSI